MAADWSNKVMNVLTVCGEQNIQNQFDGIVQKQSCVRESFSYSPRTASFFLLLFSSVHIFLFSCHFVFVMQTNAAKQKNSATK